MKLAICDDEKEIRQYIADVAKKCFPELTLSEYGDAEEIVRSDFDADILFLDIQMPGINGMDAARKIRKNGKRTVIIFVTALEEYVFNAFEVGAVGYIVKPFDEQKLIETIDRAVMSAKDRQIIEEKIKGRNRTAEIITVKSDGINITVKLSDIIYAEVLDRKITMHLSEGKDVSYYGRMADLEGMLGNDFFRIHRAYIVNMSYVKAYDWQMVNVGGSDLPVARGKYQQLVKAYMSYHTRQEGM